jgi:hypothetical protein
VTTIAGSGGRLARSIDERVEADGLVGGFVDLVAGTLRGSP